MQATAQVTSHHRYEIRSDAPPLQQRPRNAFAQLFHKNTSVEPLAGKKLRTCDVFPDSKPFTRWWWLNGPFTAADIKDQLKWLKGQGFGGVELAWLFPYWDPKADPGSPNRLEWLGNDFRKIVALTKKYAQKLGLGCDFTFGSCWPFGGSFLEPADRAQTFTGPSKQTIFESWEAPTHPPVLNHLSRQALEHYVAHMHGAFEGALEGRTSALFCDSLEIGNNTAWSPELWSKFEDRFGYSLRDHLAEIDANPHIRYDSRKILSEAIISGFYQPFTELSNRIGARTRVQCHGAPCDLLTAYAQADVPESESILFNPTFSRIPASAGALARRPVVSCETFTCLYGFSPPKHTVKKEKVRDLKLLFDAVVANGVNQIVWHGMPYNPIKKPANEFFASVHVGPNSHFVDELQPFNHYMETVCGLMRLGTTPHKMAVYLPNEDMMMKGELPTEQQTPGAGYHWEMRHVHPPREAEGYLPIWLSGDMLSKVEVRSGNLCCGDMNVPLLYIDVEWLDIDALSQLLRIVNQGGRIVLQRQPRQPGFRPKEQYEEMLQALVNHPNTLQNLQNANITPLLEGDNLPPYWAREYEGKLYLFLAHPSTANVQYPMRYEQYKDALVEERSVRVLFGGNRVDLDLRFAPGDAIMVCIDKEGKAEMIPLGF